MILFIAEHKTSDMNQNRNVNRQESNEPVLDFILGHTDTIGAKRLTKNIRSIRSLWMLAKMTDDMRNLKKYS